MTEDEVRAALAPVRDPEIGETLADLGLIERIELDAQRVHVVLVPTSATCPMADVLLDDARAALQAACPPGTEVSVAMDWDATWSPERLAPALKARFGW